MPSKQHPKSDLLSYADGAAYAVDAEIIGLIAKKNYIDAFNARLTPMNGHDWPISSIKGEDLLYPAIYNQCTNGMGDPVPFTFKCICAIEVCEYIFEIWADRLKVDPTFYRINGKIVALSPLIPFNVDHPLQWDSNSNCIGGEVFLTDYNTTPHIYSIKDLLAHSGIDFDTGEPGDDLTCDETYFEEYDPKLYTINEQLPADHPMFIEIVTSVPGTGMVIGAGGMPYGAYQYQVRFKNVAGDATLRSKATPLIPVPNKMGTEDKNYPYEKTYGGVGSSTNGIHIRFRVNNVGEYDNMEVIRISFNGEQPLGSLGTQEIVHSFNINPGINPVVDLYDFGATGSALTTEESTNTLSVIRASRSIRYFEKKLHLFNIIYASRDLDGEITLASAPDVMYPVMYKMGKAGHKDPYQSAYRHSHMHGEKKGAALLVFDSFGARAFSYPITDVSVLYPALGSFNNFQMPNRRDIPDASADVYGQGLVQSARVDNSVGDSFEVFDLAAPEFKDDVCQYKNIADLDHQDGIDSNYKRSDAVDHYCPDVEVDGGTEYTGLVPPGVKRVWVNYQPWHPTAVEDVTVTGNNMAPVTKVRINGGTDIEFPDYQPEGFAPDYYSLGMALAGVTGLPSWAAAFSIVWTPPAQRVVTQGLAMYSMDPASDAEPLTKRVTKQEDEVWFYSPDVEAGLVDWNDVVANPSNYQIQFVSPLGFFTELFNAKTSTSIIVPDDYNLDMISYARVLFDDGRINAGESGVGNAGYVEFGKWRNATGMGGFATGNGNNLFDFDTVTVVSEPRATASGRQTFYKIHLLTDLYSNPTTTDSPDFDEAGLKRFHEPFYIANIIRKNAEVDTSTNQQVYLQTEHYQKIVSIIGQSNGAAVQNMILVDERWEDCIVTGTEFKYIYVKGSDGIEKPWVNIQNQSGATVAIIITDIINGTNISGANPTGTLAGVYKQSVAQAWGEDRFYTVVFNSSGIVAANLPYYIPEVNSQIIVRYDPTYPCVSFGGDAFIGEATFAPIDGVVEDEGDEDVDPHLGQFRLNAGWPYYQMELNPRNYIFNDTQGVNKIQDNAYTFMSYVRQMIMMFCCESRIHIPLAFQADYPFRFFPEVGYVMRPQNWKNDETYNGSTPGNRVFDDYKTDYPEEIDAATDFPVGWIYGGLRWKQTDVNTNQDYSQQQNNFQEYSKPSVGFDEQNEFCTRDAWSATRETNVQNSPGLKTFPALNFRDLSDDTGAIMRAFDALSGAGSNLYAFTKRGICRLLTNKFVAQESIGGTIGIIEGQGNTTVMQEYWITKKIGLPDEWWRSFAEDGNICWFANKNSVYRFEDDTPADIGRLDYHPRVFEDLINILRPGFYDELTGHYDIYHSEYWLSYKKGSVFINFDGSVILGSDTYFNGQIFDVYLATDITLPNNMYLNISSGVVIINHTGATLDIYDTSGVIITLAIDQMAVFARTVADDNLWAVSGVTAFNKSVYGRKTFVFLDMNEEEYKKKRWLGSYDYDFDLFLSRNNETFGMRNAETYTLDKGYTINGANVKFKVVQSSVGAEVDQKNGKDFIGLKINSTEGIRPTSVYFFDSFENYKAGVVSSVLDASVGPLYLKNYDGYEAYIPRKQDAPYDRQQGRIVLFAISYEGGTQFYIVDTEVFYQNLK